MPISHTSQTASTVDAARPHLILVGLPGAGKTTVARAVGEALGRAVLDLDAEISRREGLSIAGIFASRGEAGFRDLERSLTAELRGGSGLVISPGAGWIANRDCLALLHPPAVVVYLKVSPELAVARMGLAVAERPLLAGKRAVQDVHSLLQARENMYVQSDHTVSTDTMTFSEVVGHIVALARA